MDESINTTLDLSAPVATSPDQPRHVATGDDYLSIKEALDLFVENGRPVTERTLQRYCDKEHLTCQKRITAEGEKWFALKSSVLNRIAELNEFDRLHKSRQAATSRDVSSPVAPEIPDDGAPDQERHETTAPLSAPVVAQAPSHTTSPDQPRQAATGRDTAAAVHEPTPLASLSIAERELYERLLVHLETQNEWLAKDKQALQADKDVLVRQLESKDKQIERFFASERDTKTLFGSLQSLINGIWPRAARGEIGDRYVPMREALESGLDSHRGQHEGGEHGA
jgi:hypothetical protein